MVQGNTHFKAMRWAEARDAYAEGVALVRGRQPAADCAAPLLLAPLHSNAAAACLKLEEWGAAEAQASAAIQCDSSSSKALFRRGVARARQGERNGARDDLSACITLDSSNRDARAELNKLGGGGMGSALGRAFAKEGGLYEKEDAAREKREERARTKEEEVPWP